MIALEAYYIKDLINFEDFVEHTVTASNNLAHGILSCYKLRGGLVRFRQTI